MAAAEPGAPLQLANGWHDITPQIAEQLLRHNRTNRNLAVKTVLKYASAMANAASGPARAANTASVGQLRECPYAC